jgi:hypothetical protein
LWAPVEIFARSAYFRAVTGWVFWAPVENSTDQHFFEQLPVGFFLWGCRLKISPDQLIFGHLD